MATIGCFEQGRNHQNNTRKNKLVITQKAIIISAVGVIVGGILGYSYYYFIGCSSGTCAITSKPLNSTLYGSVLGGLLFNSLFDLFKKK